LGTVSEVDSHLGGGNTGNALAIRSAELLNLRTSQPIYDEAQPSEDQTSGHTTL